MATTTPELDPATQSNYLDISTSHAHFEWDIDWDKHIILGSVEHTLVAHTNVEKPVSLDSSFLSIASVEVQGKPSKFDLKQPHNVMGSALVIPLDTKLLSGDTINIKIKYSTTEKGTAMGWLDKQQTAGKQFGYLFSQCQPIYARCLAPLQDTPSVKLTYSANVRSVLPVLMSALRVSPPAEEIHNGKEVGRDSVEYIYKQPVAIPSYIIAIAAGEQWATGVWTEPELMDASYFEFSHDTARPVSLSRFISEAEDIVTPYEFGVYDLLVLPPSFPFGGMENACLTFVTPTLIAGDRSLVDTVAHEVSHSWFGNNRVLRGRFHGPSERDLSYIIGRSSLISALKGFEKTPKYQRLVIEYERGEDPDDAYSRIPYEKGSNFLLYLERLLGGLDVFIPYAKDYIRTFRGKSIRTEQWKEHLYTYWRRHGGEQKVKILDAVDWDAWLYGDGLDLPVDVPYDTSRANDAYLLATRWNLSRTEHDVTKLPFSKTDLSAFNTHQIVVFLEELGKIGGALFPTSHMQHLDAIYSFNSSHNVEIRLRWYNIALASSSASKYANDAAEWLVDPLALKGRMKFCRPVFKALYSVEPELARITFLKNERYFHPIARRLIAKASCPLEQLVRLHVLNHF
ncbi:uncharacterized protein EI90DRAFT_3145933 [Cantharellus anzutake]|uniref:uncharacterized protein n=1 Tax=Cantharellus anzutake TaxID=1750568 RepID=UPI0019036B9A|nr:uncharacterized protein EI90DRAFT_3145933 [Cantharellus anzutake]KAF8329435.1 hypothetical protein EI90DRAFT_3145933 [Cantharellus anzutake]